MNKSDGDWRPRLSIDLTPEQAQALRRYLPHGFQKRVYSVLTDLLIAALERDGLAVLKTVLERELDLAGLLIKEKL